MVGNTSFFFVEKDGNQLSFHYSLRKLEWDLMFFRSDNELIFRVIFKDDFNHLEHTTHYL